MVLFLNQAGSPLPGSAQWKKKKDDRLIMLKIHSFKGGEKNFPGSLFHCIVGFIGFVALKIRNVRWERIYLLYFTNIRGKETQETQVIRHEKKLALAIFSFITNRESIKER